jgi:predicted TPR repeat methyltransferase
VSADYDVLASIYDRAGMGNFAKTMTPRLLNFAQQNEWIGRRILDLGCGTGVSTSFFSMQGLNVIGVDRSLAMLDQTRERLESQSISAHLVEQDIRELEGVGPVDLVIAIDVLNELESLRDLETIFARAYSVLSPGRMFIFDLKTMEGLVSAGLNGDTILYNAPDMAVFTHDEFDYERQTLNTTFHTFQRDQDAVWSRQVAERLQRAFPVQAIATLLRRQNFDVLAVVDVNFQDYNLGTSSAPRVIFFARNV